MTQQNINTTNKGFFDTATKTVGGTIGFLGSIKFPCILASIAATVGFILFTSLGNINFFVAIGGILWLLGMAAALLSGPWKYIKTFLNFTFKGWHIGWVVCPFIPTCFATALIGAVLGIMVSMALIIIAPALVGLYYYFKD